MCLLVTDEPERRALFLVGRPCEDKGRTVAATLGAVGSEQRSATSGICRDVGALCRQLLGGVATVGVLIKGIHIKNGEGDGVNDGFDLLATEDQDLLTSAHAFPLLTFSASDTPPASNILPTNGNIWVTVK